MKKLKDQNKNLVLDKRVRGYLKEGYTTNCAFDVDKINVNFNNSIFDNSPK